MIFWMAMALGAPLIVDSDTTLTELEPSYDFVEVRGPLTIVGDGLQALVADEFIRIHHSGSIVVRGVPSTGATTGPATGGAGWGAGGSAWDDTCWPLALGNPGAEGPGEPGLLDGVTPGALGGGHLLLRAPKVWMLGAIDASGEDATGRGGGGGGGRVEVEAGELKCTGTLTARGGSTSYEGGPGGGGSVVQRHTSATELCATDVAGGTTTVVACDPEKPAASGMASVEADFDFDGDGVVGALDCEPLNGDVPAIDDSTLDGRDDDCDGDYDEDAATSCFLVEDGPKPKLVCSSANDWPSSLAQCESLEPLGAWSMASIGSIEEHERMVDAIKADGTVPIPAWLGANDWLDADGVQVSDSRWSWVAPGGNHGRLWDVEADEPADLDGACAAMGTAGWVALPCEDPAPSVVCEPCLTWYYADLDGDQQGDPLVGVQACSPPAGYSVRDGDCDDTDPAVHRERPEIGCNGIDDDCDGFVDEQGLAFGDSDADGFGDRLDWSMADCMEEVLDNALDCEADLPLVPAIAELTCDAIDDDCNRAIDDGVCGASFRHLDGNAFQIVDASASADDPVVCPVGYGLAVLETGDPNQTLRLQGLLADELARVDLDEAWIGLSDEGMEGQPVWADGTPLQSAFFGSDDNNGPGDNCVVMTQSGLWEYQSCSSNAAGAICAPLDCARPMYADTDGDGWGDPSDMRMRCEGTRTYVENDGDCDDTNPLVHPGATDRVGNGIDDDCSGTMLSWSDPDGDGYGAIPVELFLHNFALPGDCSILVGINPGAAEIPGDGIDQDCNGVDDCYIDEDGDGWGTLQVVGDDLICGNNDGTAAAPGDCDDTDPTVRPGGLDAIGDGLDTNCSGGDRCYIDSDGDGYGRIPDDFPGGCDQPGATTLSGDCNEFDATIYPGAPDTPADGVDSDCDGYELCPYDADGDGIPGPDYRQWYPGCQEATLVDCDDESPEIYPGATEICDSIDQDCDPTTEPCLAVEEGGAEKAAEGCGCASSAEIGPWWVLALTRLGSRVSSRSGR